MAKTERLTVKILPSDKAALKRMATSEGEPVAVIARRIIRAAVRAADAKPAPAVEVPHATPA